MSLRLLVSKPQSGVKTIRMIGVKFGMLTVESYSHLDKGQNKLWLCRCSCGGEIKVNTTHLRKGAVTSCCVRYKKGEGLYNYTGFKTITGTKWNSIRNNALTRNLSFEITKEQVHTLLEEQNERCAISGLRINFIEKTASVDRIDNSKGYSLSNIQLVHKDLNRMRNHFDLNYFKEICMNVFKYSRERNNYMNEIQTDMVGQMAKMEATKYADKKAIKSTQEWSAFYNGYFDGYMGRTANDFNAANIKTLPPLPPLPKL